MDFNYYAYLSALTDTQPPHNLTGVLNYKILQTHTLNFKIPYIFRLMPHNCTTIQQEWGLQRQCPRNEDKS